MTDIILTDQEITKRYKEIAKVKNKRNREKLVAKIASNNDKSITPIDTLTKRYNLLYVDPPWKYEHTRSINRAIENHYNTMTLDDICNLPICNIADDPCILFMWVTNPKLAEGMRVIENWGFNYRTNFVWVKDRIGMGFYCRQQHEILTISVSGKMPVPLPENRVSSIINAKLQKHSQKPAEFYEIIEAGWPEFSKIELFARNKREGWDTWGSDEL